MAAGRGHAVWPAGYAGQDAERAVLAIRHLLQPLVAFGMARMFWLMPFRPPCYWRLQPRPRHRPVVLAARMGYNGPYVAGLVTLSTLLGIVSLPFALGCCDEPGLNRRRLLAPVWSPPFSMVAGRKPPRAQAVPLAPRCWRWATRSHRAWGLGRHRLPGQLARLTGWKVVNGGVSGDTSAQAFARLPGLLTAAPARAGHRKHWRQRLCGARAPPPRAQHPAHLQRAKGSGAQVLLVACRAVAHGRCRPPERPPAVRRDCRRVKIPLHAKGWSSVLAQERLRSDQIHANAAGYAEFAQGLVGTLRQTRAAGAVRTRRNGYHSYFDSYSGILH